MAALGQASDGSAFFDGKGVEFYNFVQGTTTAEGANAADAIDVTFQLTGRRGTPIKKQVAVFATYSTTVPVAGTIVGATSGSGLSVLTGTILSPIIAGRCLMLYPDVNGVLNLRLTIAGGVESRRIYLMLPDGRVFESTTLVYA